MRDEVSDDDGLMSARLWQLILEERPGVIASLAIGAAAAADPAEAFPKSGFGKLRVAVDVALKEAAYSAASMTWRLAIEALESSASQLSKVDSALLDETIRVMRMQMQQIEAVRPT